MVEPRNTEGQVVVERALLLELLESVERIEDGFTKISNGLMTIATAPTPDVAPPIDAPAAESRAWDTTDDALENYDAEQLVALRGDHRADHHDVAGCRVCSVLVRRLGSL